MILPPDLPSVKAFLAAYDAAVVANDPGWTLAHTDPTAIFRLPGLVTYREIEARAKWAKAHPAPSAVASCRTLAARIEIKGDRALLDFTTTIRYKPGVAHEERWEGSAVLVWRNGSWQMWRLEERLQKPKNNN